MAAAFTPERIAANDIQQHEWELREFLQMASLELKPDRTVELGTYKGWTAAILSWITSRQTISVDIQDWGTSESEAFSHNLSYMVADAATPDCVTQVLVCLGGTIDLLFIDDGHYYETIVKEVELWRPHVRQGGWIVFHDINPLANIGPHGTQPESIQVPRFWKELEGNKQEIIAGPEQAKWKGPLPHGGIGVLKL
jgi:predicted O-methyltransferase YrrM